MASPLAVKSSKSHKGPSVVNIGSEEVLWWRPQAYATRPAITSTVRENKKHHSIRGKVGGVARKAGGGGHATSCMRGIFISCLTLSPE